jgi:hypothetical protein
MTGRRIYQPRPYFDLVMDFLAEVKRCGLFLPMGSGKTSLVLSHLDICHNVLGESAPSLVLAPLRVARDGWATEAAKWQHLSGLDVVPITGTADERKAALKRDAQVYTTNYDNLVWLMEYFENSRKAWPFRRVIADESVKLKGFRTRQGTVRAQALAEVAHTLCTDWINLSGAPAPNGLKDLWGQTWFLDKGERLGASYSAFESRWFGWRKVVDALSRKMDVQPVIFPHAQDDIMGRLADICLSIKMSDYYDMREPIVNVIEVDLPASARSKYRDMEREFFIEFENGQDVEAFSAAAKSQKLLQLANGAIYLDPERYGAGVWIEVHEAKMEALESVVNEAAGTPVLCSYQFKSDLVRLMKRFPDGVDLSTQAGMAKFKAGQSPIGFGHPQSIGHGVDGLQDVTYICCMFAQDWNLDTHDQFIERIGPTRQMQSGFDRDVHMHYIVARNTVDELVMARRATKRSVQDLFLEYMKERKNA